MKIAVLDDYTDAFRTTPSYARFAGHEVIVYRDTVRDLPQLAARLVAVDGVVLTQERTALRRALIEQLPNLKVVAQTGSHRGHLDIDACTERGIVICTASAGVKAYSTSELTWGLILSSVRQIPHEVEQFRQGRWQTTIGTELHGKTLGVYGLGKIGGWVAAVGKAFGMRVSCWGREGSKARGRELGYEVPASRTEFFGGADVLTLHLYYDESTRGIVTLSLIHI